MIPIRDVNPTQRFAVITISLIAMNLAVFFYQMMLGPVEGESFIGSFALIPRRLFSTGHELGVIPIDVTLFTSMFLHGGILHVAGNMLYLWIFGNNIEDSMSRIRFIFFYFLCGAVAAYSHALTNSGSAVPMIGASGAVSGVLGAYLMLFPGARVITVVMFGFYIRMIEVPALIVLGFWFILQFLNALVTPSTGAGIAWYAHIGGFVAGMALIGLFKKRNVPFWGSRKRDDYL